MCRLIVLSCVPCRFALTKLDILDDQPVIKIGVAYLVNGQKIDYYPSMYRDLFLYRSAKNKPPADMFGIFRIDKYLAGKFSDFEEERFGTCSFKFALLTHCTILRHFAHTQVWHKTTVLG